MILEDEKKVNDDMREKVFLVSFPLGLSHPFLCQRIDKLLFIIPFLNFFTRDEEKKSFFCVCK